MAGESSLVKNAAPSHVIHKESIPFDYKSAILREFPDSDDLFIWEAFIGCHEYFPCYRGWLKMQCD